MKRLLIAAILMVAGPALAQDAYLDLLKSDVRVIKMKIIEEVMQFTEKEAAAFWPVYNKYQHEVDKINDARLDLIEDYADNYWDMTDAKARALIKKSIELDIKRAYLKKEYLRKFDHVLPSKQVAKFFQLENKIALLVQVQMATEIPLID